MEEPRDIQGLEFDWLAADQDGCLALFATAGLGPVPSSVFNALDAYDAAVGSIPISGLGSVAVWQSYAEAGLYAFDWSESLGSYVRLAEPVAGTKFNQAQSVEAIPGLPRLRCSFAQSAVIHPAWQDDT